MQQDDVRVSQNAYIFILLFHFHCVFESLPQLCAIVRGRNPAFSSPEAALLLVSTKNCDLWREARESRTSGVRPGQRLSQRSRFLVLTKRSAASGDENGDPAEYVRKLMAAEE